VQSLLQFQFSFHFRMPGERLRLSSRRGGSRGGSRGRANPQRSSHSTESSSNGIDSRGARQGRGRGRGRARATVCAHSSHPSTRFRFPCSLDNSTYYVSVRIEKCDNAVPPEVSEEQRPPSPVLCQRAQPADTSGAVAGPSEPEKDDEPYTDSSASDQYGCRIVEEQPSTSWMLEPASRAFWSGHCPRRWFWRFNGVCLVILVMSLLRGVFSVKLKPCSALFRSEAVLIHGYVCCYIVICSTLGIKSGTDSNVWVILSISQLVTVFGNLLVFRLWSVTIVCPLVIKVLCQGSFYT
jgi:hypothetical protein